MDFRRRFTLWYIRRGYSFRQGGRYKLPVSGMIIDVDDEWTCPWWVKPLLIFFSPSVYVENTVFKYLIDRLEESLKGEV